jgi:hypothetical protein
VGHPHDPDARIAKMKDGSRHLAHRVEQAVDLESGAVVAVALQPADQDDTATAMETSGAAMLVGMLTGESPVSGAYPVATVVISGGGAGDQSAESPEVKVLVGWGNPRSAPTGGRANRRVVAKANRR